MYFIVLMCSGNAPKLHDHSLIQSTTGYRYFTFSIQRLNRASTLCDLRYCVTRDAFNFLWIYVGILDPGIKH